MTTGVASVGPSGWTIGPCPPRLVIFSSVERCQPSTRMRFSKVLLGMLNFKARLRMESGVVSNSWRTARQFAGCLLRAIAYAPVHRPGKLPVTFQQECRLLLQV